MIRRDVRALLGRLGVASGIVLGCRPAEQTPPPSAGPSWLAQGATYENVTTSQSRVDRGFHFTDRLGASGITFVNRVVDDAGRDYKPMHYDHGTGVAAADVNGDGRPDLYLVTQRGTNELWLNAGGGRFTDGTDRAGLRMPDAIAVAASFADIDDDGDPDLFVTTVRHGNHLFENVGGGTFRDISAAAGVGYVGHSSGATFFDYDGDGRLDLFVTNVGQYTNEVRGAGGAYVGLKDAFLGHTHPDRAEASILYRNLGGNRFADVTQRTGLVDRSWSGDATPIDANDDGRPDLFVLDMQGQNHLWLNEGGARFRDATAAYFPRTPWGAMGAKVFDYDGDGTLDLYVTDMHSDMFGDIVPGDWAQEMAEVDPSVIPRAYVPNGEERLSFGNALYARRTSSRGETQFDHVTQRAGVETYWPWGPSVGDLNADGWDDLIVTGGMSFPFRYAVNAVLLNDGGRRFVRSEFALGVEPRAGGTEQEWFRLDCGGADRVHPSCGICAKPHAAEAGCRGDPKGRLTIIASRSSRSSVVLDIDDDGDLDVVTNEFNGPPQILVSDLAERRRVAFVKVRLRGTRSNRDGLGAQVTVVLPDNRRVLQVADGVSGYLSKSDLPLYFGLGAADHATSLEVRWPSGTRQSVAGPILAGRTIDVVEP